MSDAAKIRELIQAENYDQLIMSASVDFRDRHFAFIRVKYALKDLPEK